MLAIETILGALTGYFTNDIAIRQLFSKNGVVVRERDEFTNLIVSVLKNEIITEEITTALKTNPEIKSAFERSIRTLFSEEIPYNLLGCTLADFDNDGDIYEVVHKSIEETSLDDGALNTDYLFEVISEVMNQEAFQATVGACLARFGKITIRQLGLADVIEKLIDAIEKMSSEEWQAQVAAWEKSSFLALEASWNVQLPNDDCTLASVLNINGEEAFTAFIRAVWQSEEAFNENLIATLKKPEFQENVYNLAERLLPEVVMVHLPTIIEAFYPLIEQDRLWLEKMVLDSIGACAIEGNFIFEAVQNFAATFFSQSQGKSWLADLYEKATTFPGAEELCRNCSQFLLSFVVREIDRWRRLDTESAAEVEALVARYSTIRRGLIALLDWFLRIPLSKNIAIQRFVVMGVRVIFALMKRDGARKRLINGILDLQKKCLDKPLENSLLSEELQAGILSTFMLQWQVNGKKWLDRLDITTGTLSDVMGAFFDKLYHMPLTRLLCHGNERGPFEVVTAFLLDAVFDNLGDFLGRLTHEQLDSLSQEEMRQLVLEMMGREMRPLTYLGGGIGTVAGLATGVAVGLSGMTLEPEQVAALVAARSGMYGAVGYGTNVVAVNGLFKPYKKTLGFQGLMSKNQKRFASKMSEMAQAYIINDDIWFMQVQAISARYERGYDALLEKTWEYVESYRVPVLSSFIQNDATVHYLSKYITRAARAHLLKDNTKKYIASVLYEKKWAEAFVEMNRFYGLSQRALVGVAMREVTTQSLSEGVAKGCSEIQASQLARIIQECFGTAKMPAERVFYECLWDKCLPYYKLIPEYLLEHAEFFAGIVGGWIYKKLPFLLQMGFRSFGGQALVNDVFTVFVRDKLPGYLFNRQKDFCEISIQWAMDTIADVKFADLGVNISLTEGLWLKNWMTSIKQDQWHHFLLHVLMRCEKLPNDLSERVVAGACQLIEVVLKQQHDKNAADKVLRLFSWDVGLAPFIPGFVAVSREVLSKGQWDRLMSLSEGSLLKWLDEMTCFAPDERNRIIGATHDMQEALAPAIEAFLVQHGKEIVSLVDVPKITYEQIIALSPEGLEKMVRHIAQPYFLRVERMGWLGAVVAVPATALSIFFGGV